VSSPFFLAARISSTDFNYLAVVLLFHFTKFVCHNGL
jgi:hypothetical protein